MEKADAEELKEKLEESLGKEKGVGYPAVRVEFAYAPHRTARDMQKLRELVAEADVIALESVGVGEDELRAWRDLSEGTITPERAFRKLEMSHESEGDQRWLREYEIIYNSHKAIDSIDVPSGHPLNTEIADAKNAPTFYYDGDFEKALESMKNYTKNWAAVQKKREEYMLSRLKEVAKEHAFPEQKRKLNILISMGAVHTGMWHKLKSEGVDAHAAFGSTPFIFKNADELLRRYLFGKAVDNELVANALLETIFFDRFGWPPTEDTEKAFRFFRRLVSQFTVSEIKEIFEKLGNKNLDEQSRVLIEKLRMKHIRWPRNEKEIDAFSGTKTPSG